MGAVVLTAVQNIPIGYSEANAIYYALDGLVLKVGVLSVHHTEPSEPLRRNLTRNLAYTNRILSIFFSGNVSALVNGFGTEDLASGLLTLGPSLDPVIKQAQAAYKHLSGFDFCPIDNGNVMMMRVVFGGYLDPNGVAPRQTRPKEMILKSLVGTTLDILVGKPQALSNHLNNSHQLLGRRAGRMLNWVNETLLDFDFSLIRVPFRCALETNCFGGVLLPDSLLRSAPSNQRDKR